MMHLFWTSVIAPLLDGADAGVVVEIGVDQGGTTSLLVERAERRQGGIVHAIDPAPAVAASDLERSPGGALRFHHGLSHDVLPGIGPVDAVLLDGDHNWFTVSGELRLLAATAAATATPLPLVIAHDVGWPYSRRDMYYDPASVPDESRHEAAREGVVPGRSELGPDGMNPWLWNATHEGGPRNGVLTAIEDFVSDYDEHCDLLVLEGFHGVGVLVSTTRLDESPGLPSALAHLRSPEFSRSWAATLERARVDAELLAWRSMGKPSPASVR